MSTFKAFAELTAEEGEDGTTVIRHKGGAEFVMTTDNAQRLVDCWNACRKLQNPENHITATDDYVKRLETLRKEAWATAVELGANEFRAPGNETLWPL